MQPRRTLMGVIFKPGNGKTRTTETLSIEKRTCTMGKQNHDIGRQKRTKNFPRILAAKYRKKAAASRERNRASFGFATTAKMVGWK